MTPSGGSVAATPPTGNPYPWWMSGIASAARVMPGSVATFCNCSSERSLAIAGASRSANTRAGTLISGGRFPHRSHREPRGRVDTPGARSHLFWARQGATRWSSSAIRSASCASTGRSPRNTTCASGATYCSGSHVELSRTTTWSDASETRPGRRSRAAARLATRCRAAPGTRRTAAARRRRMPGRTRRGRRGGETSRPPRSAVSGHLFGGAASQLGVGEPVEIGGVHAAWSSPRGDEARDALTGDIRLRCARWDTEASARAMCDLPVAGRPQITITSGRRACHAKRSARASRSRAIAL